MPKQKNIKRLSYFSFFFMFFISIPVLVPYSLSLGLSMQEILMVQSFFALIVAIMEIPSGYYCDLYGRRQTLILGGVFYGIGFTLLSFVTTFQGMLIYEFFTGIAFSLISGADVAFLYDQMDEGHSREDKSKALAQMQFSQTTAEAIGSILGGLLASVSLKLPFIMQAIVSWFPLVIALTFKEVRTRKMGQDHKENFVLVFKELMKAECRPTLINLVIWGLSTFCSVWILQKYWQEQNIPYTYFGILWAFFNFSAGLTGKNIGFLKRYFSNENLLLLAGALPVIAYFALGLLPGTVVIFFALLFYIARGLIQVILREHFNHHLSDDMRATANSVQSFLFRITFAVVGPIIGYSLDQQGTRSTLVYLGIVFGLMYVVILVPYIKKQKNSF